MKRIVIAIDGPAGAGKSTISKIIAKRINIEYIDTGAMYRAIALKALNNGIDFEDIDGIEKLLKDTDINFNNGKIYLDGIDVSGKIRTPEMSSLASSISAIKVVREKLVYLQRLMAAKKSLVMDGRDIGTNVLKDAKYKIYLTATVEERASRRYNELCKKNIDVTFENICKDIITRDKNDMERKINPLYKAEDAILVDTTGKSIEEVVNEILNIVMKDGE
ncbi:MAG: (d)CMP kinase [Clostridiales bacterium]|nr:(d)CMP kinase [Clostridiales bacterium]